MKSKMLVFLNSFWSRGTIISGGDVVAVEVVKSVADKFEEIVWVTNFSGKKFIGPVNAYEYIIYTDLLDRLGVTLSYILRIFFIFFKKRFYNFYNTALSTSDFLTDVLPAFIYKKFNPQTNWVCFVHHIYPSYKIRNGNKLLNFIAQYAQKISFRLLKKADCVIAHSHQLKQTLLEIGLENVQIVYPKIKYLENIALAKEKYNGVFMSRLKPSKGIFELIDIWQLVVQQIKSAKLAIIGAGENKIIKKIKNKIRVKNLENNIQMFGHLNDEFAFSLIKSSDVFLLPSHEEGFSLVIAEVMAQGVPVIAWGLPVFDEIYEDKIIKVKEKDKVCFSRQIIELLLNTDKRRAFGEQGKKFVLHKFNWQTNVEKYLNILCH